MNRTRPARKNTRFALSRIKTKSQARIAFLGMLALCAVVFIGGAHLNLGVAVREQNPSGYLAVCVASPHEGKILAVGSRAQATAIARAHQQATGDHQCEVFER
jgi:hypothetical protein